MSLFKNRNFLLLWQGQLVSQMGSKISLIALSWYFVAHINHNQGFVLLLLISSLPALLLGVLVGPFVDRWNKKHILIASDFLSALIAAVLAMLIYFQVTQHIYIYICVFLLSVMTLFFNPAATAMVPALVNKEQVQQGISLQTMVMFVAQFAGAALGGVLVALTGVFWAIMINALSFLLSAVSELFIRYTHQRESTEGGHFNKLREGFHYVKERPVILRQFILFSLLNLFAVPMTVFIPILVDDYLGLGSIAFGFAESGLPVGAIAAAILMAGLAATNHIKWLKNSMVLLSLAFFIIFLGRDIVCVVGAMVVFGFFLNTLNINAVSFYAKAVAPGMQGRFFTLLDTVAFGSFPLAYLATGLLIQHIDAYDLVLANGLAVFALGLFSFFYLRQKPSTSLGEAAGAPPLPGDRTPGCG